MPQAVDPQMAAIRRANLLHLVVTKFASNKNELARACEQGHNHLNLVMTDNERHQRPMGEGLARRLEEKLSLPDGWFDQPRSGLGDLRLPIRVKGMPIHKSLRECLKEPVISIVEFPNDGLPDITAPFNLILASPAHSSAIANDSDTLVIDIGQREKITDGVYVLMEGRETIIAEIAGRKMRDGGRAFRPIPTRGVKAFGKVICRIQASML